MFLIFKKRSLWITVGCVLLLCIILGAGVSLYCYVPKRELHVVVDAGHGGSDGGVSGVKSGVKESEINLLVAFNLKTILEERGVRVTLTRESDSVLEEGESGKSVDFEKRKRVINDAKPNLVVSIHQNKFPDGTRRGSQVFYNGNSKEGRNLASAVQQSLNELNERNVGRTFSALKGDYYILNCSQAPSCIVECGFLSNEKDEELLLNAEYRNELAGNLAKGILAYLNERSL